MSDLYARDFVAWTEQQAQLLRDLAARGTNLPLDWEHLAEEVEGLGRSELHALASQIRRVIVHLLKLEFSPATGPRRGWRETVRNARAEIESLLQSDPGLRPRLSGLIAGESVRAGRLAAAALADRDEDAAGVLARLRSAETYAEAQVLGDFLPEHAGHE